MDTFRNLITIIESKQGVKINLEEVGCDINDLEPVLSSEAVAFHHETLAKGYVDRYNSEEGDVEFNYAGAILHNLYFPQLTFPKKANKPIGKSLDLINKSYKSFDEFKDRFTEEALKIQGSGWVYLDKYGEIKTIKNHATRNNIALIIDMWEHAWMLDYSNMSNPREQYLKHHWRIINWNIVNERID